MSTICLAAQRSRATGEAVFFVYRLTSWKKIFSYALLWLAIAGAMLLAGLYTHVYWHYRHPLSQVVAKTQEQQETRLSDMHYVYVSKPFPVQKSQIADKMPPADFTLADDPASSEDDNDWTHTPDGALATQPLPGTDDTDRADSTETQEVSLKERLMQAMKEQQQDYSQGKIPDEATDTTENDHNKQPVDENDKTTTSHYAALVEQPESVQKRLPALRYQSHIYASDPQQSRLEINDKQYKVGEQLAPGITIAEIQPHEIILAMNGGHYMLPALTNWTPPND